MSTFSPAEVREIRSEFPALRRYVYLATNGLGLLPRRAVAAARALLNRLRDDGIVYEIFSSRERIREVRHQVSRFVGADPTEVAFSRNTTEGILWFTHSYPWQGGDEVLALQGSYPSTVLPFLARRCEGVRVRFLAERDRRLSAADVAQAWGERTRVLALSWVQFHSGFRAPLEELVAVVHQRSGLVVCDGIQGLGALPFSAHDCGVDLLAAGAQKWLIGPPGLGVVVIRRRLLDRLHPHHVGLGSLVRDHDPEDPQAPYDEQFFSEARRFEEGMRNWLGIEMLSASLSLLAEVGVERIARHIKSLTDLLIDRVTPLGWTVESPRGEGEWSGILLLRPPEGQSAEGWMHRLHEEHVAINHREGCLHLGIHFYNDERDLMHLVRLMRAAGPPRG